MPTTATAPRTVKTVIDEGNTNEVGVILSKMKLATLHTPIKRAFTGLAAAAAFDLTAIDGTGETAGAANPNRLGAAVITSLRITASGTAASVGAYIACDDGATKIIPPGGASAAVGVATLSDDGKTVTFPNTVTAFTIVYLPRTISAVDMAADFAPTV